MNKNKEKLKLCERCNQSFVAVSNNGRYCKRDKCIKTRRKEAQDRFYGANPNKRREYYFAKLDRDPNYWRDNKRKSRERLKSL